MLDLLLDGLLQFGGWLSDSPRRRWHQQVKQAGLWPAYDDSMGFFAVDRQGKVWFPQMPRIGPTPSPSDSCNKCTSL